MFMPLNHLSTSIVCKLLDGMIRDQELVGENSFISSNNQYGFMKGRSCQSNLLMFYVEVSYLYEEVSHLDKGRPVMWHIWILQ